MSKQKQSPLDSRLEKVYAHRGDKRDLFDAWAGTYDQDLLDDLGYKADFETCRVFMDYVENRSARVLDAGCGTGLVGRRLDAAGYKDLHGSDYAEKMLQEAAKTGAYQSLRQHDLTEPIEAEVLYDAAIAVGVFAFSQPSAEHLVHLTRCLVEGGYAFVTVNGKAWLEVGWEGRLEGFEIRFPDCRIVEILPIEYLTKEGIDGRLLVLQRVC